MSHQSWYLIERRRSPLAVVNKSRKMGSCGIMLYVRATHKRKMAACRYISAHGPPVTQSTSYKLFTTSTLPVSSVTLLEAFKAIPVVAIFSFGMKCRSRMDPLTWLPAPTHQGVYLYSSLCPEEWCWCWSESIFINLDVNFICLHSS